MSVCRVVVLRKRNAQGKSAEWTIREEISKTNVNSRDVCLCGANVVGDSSSLAVPDGGELWVGRVLSCNSPCTVRAVDAFSVPHEN
jgi:hypothetical protein